MSRNDSVICYKRALTVATTVTAFRVYSCQVNLKFLGCLFARESQLKKRKESHCYTLAKELKVQAASEDEVFTIDLVLNGKNYWPLFLTSSYNF